MEAIIYGKQLELAEDAADAQRQQIRDQQVTLRLQENQNEIVRMQKLRQVLASQQVIMGTRNIAGTSGTVRAITEGSLQNYIQDQNADQLNFTNKQLALSNQYRMVGINESAQKLQATAGFIKNVESDVAMVASAGAGGAAGGSGGAMAGAGAAGGTGYLGGGVGTPYNNASLFDYGANMNLNG